MSRTNILAAVSSVALIAGLAFAAGWRSRGAEPERALFLHIPRATPERSPSQRAWEISLDDAGALSLDGKPLALEELQGVVGALHPRPGLDLVALRVARGTPFERVQLVLGELHRGGVTEFGFVEPPLRDAHGRAETPRFTPITLTGTSPKATASSR